MLDDDRKLILFNTSKKVFKNNCTVAHAKGIEAIYILFTFLIHFPLSRSYSLLALVSKYYTID